MSERLDEFDEELDLNEWVGAAWSPMKAGPREPPSPDATQLMGK